VIIKTLIIVPARSGSKGIPDKNIKFLAGKPLLSWTAHAVAYAGCQDALAIVSTDSAEYAEIAKQYGLRVPFLRPEEFAKDQSSSMAVVEHALDWFANEYGYLPEQTMLLQPTSPFRSSFIIKQALKMLQEPEVNAVVGCKEIHRDLTTLFQCDSGYLKPLSTKKTQVNRQQIKPLLTPNGAMYLCKTLALLACKSFYPDHTGPLLMNAVMSLDIDTPEDWTMAEALARMESIQ
jgi:N-acylneuraminate cytidylyltransferase/CMP-N,N'-diacetyllegionaminic acid synthase